MENNRNVHFAITRKILILIVLCLFLISQNISGLLHDFKASVVDHSEIRWELLLINMSEIILIILYYSQLDMDISEHFKGDTWDLFLNNYVLKSYRYKILFLKAMACVLPFLFIAYSFLNGNYYLFATSIGLFTSIYLVVSIDAYFIYRIAGKASDYF